MDTVSFPPTYQVESDGSLFHAYPLESGNEVRYSAQDVRRERTGVHARLEISLNHVTLGWSNFNIERDEDRVRLANSTHRGLGDLDRGLWDQNTHKHGLDLFCLNLWTEYITTQVGGWTYPANERKPIELVTPWAVKDGGTILFGPPKSAKTFMGLLAALCMTYKNEKFFPVIQTPNIYVNLERPESEIQQRLLALEDALGMEHKPLLMLHRRGHSLADVQEAIKVMCAREGVTYGFVDSLSRAGVGSLTEDAPMNKAMDILNATFSGYTLIAHTPRADETRPFGSIMADAAADVLVRVSKHDKGNEIGVGLNVTGANDIQTGLRALFALTFDKKLGLTAIRNSNEREFAEAGQGGKPSRHNRALALYRESPDTGVGPHDMAKDENDRANWSTFFSQSQDWTPIPRVKGGYQRYKPAYE